MRTRLPEHAAYTLRTILLGTILYIGVITIVWLIHNTWIDLLLVPGYLGLGHLLRLWDLSDIPDLIHRVLPRRIVFRTALQPKHSLDSKKQ
jgi:hypothetical protein